MAQKLKNVLIKNYLKERELAARGSHRGDQTSLLTVRQRRALLKVEQPVAAWLSPGPTNPQKRRDDKTLSVLGFPSPAIEGGVGRSGLGGRGGGNQSLCPSPPPPPPTKPPFKPNQNMGCTISKAQDAMIGLQSLSAAFFNQDTHTITAQMIKLDVLSCPTALPQARTGHLNVVPQLVRLALGEHWELRQKQICHSRSHIFPNTKETYFLSGSSGNASRPVQKVHKIRIS